MYAPTLSVATGKECRQRRAPLRPPLGRLPLLTSLISPCLARRPTQSLTVGPPVLPPCRRAVGHLFCSLDRQLVDDRPEHAAFFAAVANGALLQHRRHQRRGAQHRLAVLLADLLVVALAALDLLDGLLLEVGLGGVLLVLRLARGIDEARGVPALFVHAFKDLLGDERGWGFGLELDVLVG